MGAFIQWCLSHLNYWTIMFLMTIESSFIPFPSEIVVPPAAYHAASSGEMNIFLIILFATIGAIFGALINYFLALGISAFSTLSSLFSMDSMASMHLSASVPYSMLMGNSALRTPIEE